MRERLGHSEHRRATHLLLKVVAADEVSCLLQSLY